MDFSSLRDNPTLALFARDAARNALTIRSAVFIFWLFCMPSLVLEPSRGAWVVGTVPAQRDAYFAAVYGMLMIFVPVLLLFQTYGFCQRLIQGRVLEEILLTRVEPADVADSLLLAHLRRTTPLMGLLLAALTPVIVLEARWSAFLWPLWSFVISSACCLILYKAMLKQCLVKTRAIGGYSWEFLAVSGLLGLFLAPNRYLVIVLVVVVWAALAIRRELIGQLQLLSGGNFPGPTSNLTSRNSVGRLEAWLSDRFVDRPLAYRQLRRLRIFSPSNLLFNLCPVGILLGIQGGRTLGWTCVLLAAGLAYATAVSQLLREKSTGNFEILMQGGVTRDDFSQSYFWLSLFRWSPASLLLWLQLCHQYDSELSLVSHCSWQLHWVFQLCWALGTGLSLLCAQWCGAKLGTRAGFLCEHWRGCAAAFLGDFLWVALVAAMLSTAPQLVLPNLGASSIWDLVVVLISLRCATAWLMPSWRERHGQSSCSLWALFLLPAFPVAVYHSLFFGAWAEGCSFSYQVPRTQWPLVLLLPWLILSGRATSRIHNFRLASHWLGYLGWVLNYLLFQLFISFGVLWTSFFLGAVSDDSALLQLAMTSLWMPVSCKVVVWALLLGGLLWVVAPYIAFGPQRLEAVPASQGRPRVGILQAYRGWFVALALSCMCFFPALNGFVTVAEVGLSSDAMEQEWARSVPVEDPRLKPLVAQTYGPYSYEDLSCDWTSRASKAMLLERLVFRLGRLVILEAGLKSLDVDDRAAVFGSQEWFRPEGDVSNLVTLFGALDRRRELAQVLEIWLRLNQLGTNSFHVSDCCRSLAQQVALRRFSLEQLSTLEKGVRLLPSPREMVNRSYDAEMLNILQQRFRSSPWYHLDNTNPLTDWVFSAIRRAQLREYLVDRLQPGAISPACTNRSFGRLVDPYNFQSFGNRQSKIEQETVLRQLLARVFELEYYHQKHGEYPLCLESPSPTTFGESYQCDWELGRQVYKLSVYSLAVPTLVDRPDYGATRDPRVRFTISSKKGEVVQN